MQCDQGPEGRGGPKTYRRIHFQFKSHKCFDDADADKEKPAKIVAVPFRLSVDRIIAFIEPDAKRKKQYSLGFYKYILESNIPQQQHKSEPDRRITDNDPFKKRVAHIIN